MEVELKPRPAAAIAITVSIAAPQPEPKEMWKLGCGSEPEPDEAPDSNDGALDPRHRAPLPRELVAPQEHLPLPLLHVTLIPPSRDFLFGSQHIWTTHHNHLRPPRRRPSRRFLSLDGWLDLSTNHPQ
ncbi:hypothetical protein NE237_014970 [Protea cynaroides]|uniref:Uncharacterized protein n=1 Tax=Protea cynaroides TaxID=273540 RepID=A0A9Q0KD55_9MAGN|nr:hypothetical protein NE237_014970 [Protea cynaroides]